MKKYLILSLISVSIILTVIATGYTRIENIDYAHGIRVEKTTAVERLNYNGTVEYGDSALCSAGGSGIVQSVLVNEGDFVKKGDPIIIAAETKTEINTADIYSAAANGYFSLINSVIGGDLSIVTYEAKSSGIVRDLNAEVNGLYIKGDSLFKVSSDDTFQIQINVSEKDISKIKMGQKADIDCKAVSDMLKGTVKDISTSAKQTSTSFGKETTVKVLISIDNPNSEIKTGYSAACSINVQEKNDTLLIPYSAYFRDDNGENYVYVMSENKLEKRYIVCGCEYSNGLEVVEGLSEGDIIISDISSVNDPYCTVINEVSINEQ